MHTYTFSSGSDIWVKCRYEADQNGITVVLLYGSTKYMYYLTSGSDRLLSNFLGGSRQNMICFAHTIHVFIFWLLWESHYWCTFSRPISKSTLNLTAEISLKYEMWLSEIVLSWAEAAALALAYWHDRHVGFRSRNVGSESSLRILAYWFMKTDCPLKAVQQEST